MSSLEVRIDKEARDYQESLFFGLALWQFTFALLAVAVTVGICFDLRPASGSEVSWVCILTAFPFALGGFFRHSSMTFKRFILVMIHSELLYSKRLIFRLDRLYVKVLESSALKEALKPGQNPANHVKVEQGDTRDAEIRTGRHPHPPPLAG